MRTIDIEAAVCIVASDQVWRNPGERWACPAEEAEGLIASGAALQVEPEPSRPRARSSPKRPAPAPAPEGAAAEADPTAGAPEPPPAADVQSSTVLASTEGVTVTVGDATGEGDAAPRALAGGSTIQVSGIGPSTEAALAQAGVRSLADLAALTDEQIAGLKLDENIKRRIRDDWRQAAMELLDAGGAPA